MLFNVWQEQGFKGKQMVVKPSCNNRLQCVQYVFFCQIQLLVSWEWSLSQVACWCSWTPSVYRRRKIKRKSFIQRKLLPFQWELWGRRKTSGWWTNKWRISSRSRWCVLCTDSTRYQVDNTDTRTTFFYTWRNFTTFTRQSWPESIDNLGNWDRETKWWWFHSLPIAFPLQIREYLKHRAHEMQLHILH